MTTNKTMIVTGASRGLGAAVAQLAAERGYVVCVNYAHDEERANRVVAEIRDQGGKALAIRADVGNDDDVVAMFKRVDAEFGGLDVLINNAGIARPISRVDALQLQDIKRMFETNVYGTLLCSREAIQRMSHSHGGGGGAIVNLSSVASRLGGAGRNVHYAASKGAIDSMTIGMAREVAVEPDHGAALRAHGFEHAVGECEAAVAGREMRAGRRLPRAVHPQCGQCLARRGRGGGRLRPVAARRDRHPTGSTCGGANAPPAACRDVSVGMSMPSATIGSSSGRARSPRRKRSSIA